MIPSALLIGKTKKNFNIATTLKDGHDKICGQYDNMTKLRLADINSEENRSKIKTILLSRGTQSPLGMKSKKNKGLL